MSRGDILFFLTLTSPVPGGQSIIVHSCTMPTTRITEPRITIIMNIFRLPFSLSLVPFALHLYHSMVLAPVKWGYAFSEKIFQGSQGGGGIRWSSCRMHGMLYAHEAWPGDHHLRRQRVVLGSSGRTIPAA